MFRTAAPAAEPAPVVMDSPPSDLIPLSVIKLDLPEPGEGWGAFLAARDVDVKTDDIGRPSVTRATARMLIAEHASNEAKKALLRQDAERRAVEEDREPRTIEQRAPDLERRRVEDRPGPPGRRSCRAHSTR